MRLVDTHSPSRLSSVVWSAALLGVTGCTDVDLILVTADSGATQVRQSIFADVCAPPPILEETPYKVLFVIDTSFSNSWNDPQGRREAGVRNAISAHSGQEYVSFGIITFADEARLQTFGFTRDLTILDGATQNISATQGGTNYSDTTWAVINFVTQDASSVAPIELARTHYLIFWLSDGIPTVGVTNTTALLPGIVYLRSELEAKVAEITFNTLYVGGVPPTTPDESAAARDLLLQMAANGGGSFTNVPAGESFSFVIDPKPIIRSFVFQAALANNRHAQLVGGRAQADSDADGLTDKLEREMGLDPLLADSDGDGYGDGVEVLLPLRLDPAVPDQGCDTGDRDADGDGLSDCEELALGTLPENPDSDGDQILDRIEVLSGTSALATDPLVDVDLDGVPDQDEVSMHLPPREPNDAATTDRWAYRYGVNLLDTGTPEQPCYRIQVDNLWMAETAPDGERPKGGNIIELVATFATDGDRLETRFLRAEMRGRFLAPDYEEPADGKFVLTPEHFADIRGQACNPGEERPCGLGVGACVMGVQTCDTSGFWAMECKGGTGPQPELCNGLDDDCDSLVDEAPECTQSHVVDPSAETIGATIPDGVTIRGGGCAATASSTGTAALALVALLVVPNAVRRRRDRGGRQGQVSS
jgi:hypothetical protein